ncbi:hypothetical protein SEA_DUMPTRUCK_6 [Gordonia phage DumpTruck]|nr:hypothetical protein SEA_DUMPTRUCK_6 [Gordonia phage DumpTruck]
MAKKRKKLVRRTLKSSAARGRIPRDKNGKFVNASGRNRSKGANLQNLKKGRKAGSKNKAKRSTAYVPAKVGKTKGPSRRGERVGKAIGYAAMAGAIGYAGYVSTRKQGGPSQKPMKSKAVPRATNRGQTRANAAASSAIKNFGGATKSAAKAATSGTVRARQQANTKKYKVNSHAWRNNGGEFVKSVPKSKPTPRATPGSTGRSRYSVENVSRLSKARKSGQSIKSGALRQKTSRAARASVMAQLGLTNQRR